MTKIATFFTLLASSLLAIIGLASRSGRLKERGKIIEKDSENARDISNAVAADRRVRAARDASADPRGYRD